MKERKFDIPLRADALFLTKDAESGQFCWGELYNEVPPFEPGGELEVPFNRDTLIYVTCPVRTRRYDLPTYPKPYQRPCEGRPRRFDSVSHLRKARPRT
jgi:hypothetical protein